MAVLLSKQDFTIDSNQIIMSICQKVIVISIIYVYNHTHIKIDSPIFPPYIEAWVTLCATPRTIRHLVTHGLSPGSWSARMLRPSFLLPHAVHQGISLCDMCISLRPLSSRYSYDGNLRIPELRLSHSFIPIHLFHKNIFFHYNWKEMSSTHCNKCKRLTSLSFLYANFSIAGAFLLCLAISILLCIKYFFSY